MFRRMSEYFEYARKPLAASGRSSPAALHELLEAGEVLDRAGLPVADDDLGFLPEDRLHELGDLRLRVLVVPVGVHDDVRTVQQRVVDAVTERAGETHVRRVVHEVLDAVLLGDLDGAVGAAVVDHQDLDLVDAVDLSRDGVDDAGEGVLLVEAGDLDE
jgi:hypothetical protein